MFFRKDIGKTVARCPLYRTLGISCLVFFIKDYGHIESSWINIKDIGHIWVNLIISHRSALVPAVFLSKIAMIAYIRCYRNVNLMGKELHFNCLFGGLPLGVPSSKTIEILN